MCRSGGWSMMERSREFAPRRPFAGGFETMEQATLGTDLLSALSNQMADAVERVGPALVQVNGRQGRPASGIVVAPDLVLTADHVLEREDDLTIRTHDGRTLTAQFAGRDPATDLAVLRVAELG